MLYNSYRYGAVLEDGEHRVYISYSEGNVLLFGRCMQCVSLVLETAGGYFVEMFLSLSVETCPSG